MEFRTHYRSLECDSPPQSEILQPQTNANEREKSPSVRIIRWVFFRGVGGGGIRRDSRKKQENREEMISSSLQLVSPGDIIAEDDSGYLRYFFFL